MENVVIKTCNKNTIKDILNLINTVMRPGREKGHRMEDEFPQLFSEKNFSNIYYIEFNGKPVSTMSIIRNTVFLNGVSTVIYSLGSVCTLEEYRNKGYATLLLDYIIKKISNKRASLLFISGTINLYKKFDCIEFGKNYMAKISYNNVNKINSCLPFEFNVEKNRELIADKLLEIYEMERYRYERNKKSIELLLNGLWFKRYNYDMQLFTIKLDKKVIAYIIAYNIKGQPDINILEYAGSRYAIINSFNYIMSYFNTDAINMKIHLTDFELIEFINNLNCQIKEIKNQGTVRIINAKKFFNDTNLWFVNRYTNKIYIYYDNEKYILKSKKFEKKFFSLKDLEDFIFNFHDNSIGFPLIFTDDLNYI